MSARVNGPWPVSLRKGGVRPEQSKGSGTRSTRSAAQIFRGSVLKRQAVGLSSDQAVRKEGLEKQPKP